MLYCTKYCPKEFILCAGNDKNEAIIYDYSILQMVGGITYLENAVYCADTDVNRPNMIVGSEKKKRFLLSMINLVFDKQNLVCVCVSLLSAFFF